ncbi:MAG: hypothetical protein GY757_51015 [bacterium]|nr:hypothetical protein [bacterium]
MSLSPPINTLRQQIAVTLNDLPPEGLKEVANFLEYIRFKFKKPDSRSTPYRPVALGGLWKDETIEEKDIDDIRKEMWNDFGNREL